MSARDELQFAPGIPYSDRLIAAFDELDIEADLIRLREGPDTTTRRLEDASCVAALVRIDALKIAGDYEGERARLRLRLGLPEYPQSPPLIANNATDALSNLIALEKSPDARQRERASAFVEATRLDAMSLAEAKPLILPLEKAHKRKGRPKAKPPWRDHAAELDAIRLAVAYGEKPTPAAQSIHNFDDEKARALRGHWAARQKLRSAEKN